MKRPPKLYKYEAISSQSLLNLKGQIIYFASPTAFNDPFDCALAPEISIPTDEEMSDLVDSYLDRDDVPENIKDEAREMNIEKLRGVIAGQASSALEKQVEVFQGRNGIACFSEENDSLLMWSHYSDGGRGFCLEFSTEHYIFSNMEKVEYSDQMPSANPVDLLIRKKIPALSKLFATKSKSWSYEKEWRVLHQQAGTPYCYPEDLLTGIYFGPKVDQQALEMICIILQGQNPQVKFWKGERVPGKFQLEFRQFTYTNPVEAKRIRAEQST